jgi:CubicO group peptidase (beta-lactamase class C family)
MVECLAHLPLSAGFRERFQYNNLSAAAAGYIAEVVTGQSWNDLVRERILEPLCMNNTRFSLPPTGNATLSYHESHDRRLVVTRRLETGPIGPAGGCIHSTVDDMTRWMAFNLSGGKVAGRQLIEPGTLREIQSPCMVMGGDTASPSPKAAYGLGWFVDTYNGRSRVSHTGWLHDVNGCLTLFPDEGLGIVSFINFASSRIAQLINQCAFDLLMDLVPVQTLKDALAKYEKNVEDTRRRNKSVRRIENAVPSHPLTAYAGSYQHAGYGKVEIVLNGQVLSFVRNSLVLPMEHWHYDAWVIAENDLFEIHKQQPFERANRILFETSADGEIIAFSMQVEPTVAPMRFTKQ